MVAGQALMEEGFRSTRACKRLRGNDVGMKGWKNECRDGRRGGNEAGRQKMDINEPVWDYRNQSGSGGKGAVRE